MAGTGFTFKQDSCIKNGYTVDDYLFLFDALNLKDKAVG